MSSIYLAGASSEVDQCEAYMRLLRDAGWRVTFDWTVGLRANQAAGKRDIDLTLEEMRSYASADLEGVRQADWIWVLAPEPPNASTGCWVELGDALRSGRGRVVVSGHWRRCIFAALAGQRFALHDEALAWLLRRSS